MQPCQLYVHDQHSTGKLFEGTALPSPAILSLSSHIRLLHLLRGGCCSLYRARSDRLSAPLIALWLGPVYDAGSSLGE